MNCKKVKGYNGVFTTYKSNQFYPFCFHTESQVVTKVFLNMEKIKGY